MAGKDKKRKTPRAGLNSSVVFGSRIARLCIAWLTDYPGGPTMEIPERICKEFDLVPDSEQRYNTSE